MTADPSPYIGEPWRKALGELLAYVQALPLTPEQIGELGKRITALLHETDNNWKALLGVNDD